MAVDILSQLNKNGSGLNLSALTDSLVAAEITPLKTAQQRKVDTANLSISTLGQVRSQFQGVQTAISALIQTPILKATSSNAGVGVTVTDPAKITNGSMNIEVVQRAERQVLEFKGFASADATVGAGVLTVEVGAWYEAADGTKQFAANPAATAQSLTIPAGATLSHLAESLNTLPGVSARVIDKGDGSFSLGIVSEPGAGSGLRFTAAETAAGLSAFDTTATNATVQIQGAQDAVLSVDGIAVFRPSNTITDLIPGATVEVTAAAGAVANVGFTRDIEVARANLSYLVEQVNATRAKLDEVSARGVNGAPAGALMGDPTVEAMKSQLSRLIAAPIEGFGAPVYLADLGVATQRDGTLKLQTMKFEAAFKADPARFDAVFANRLHSDTAGVEVSGVVGTQAKAGTHAFLRDAVTGKATLDGFKTLRIPLPDGRQRYAVLDGPMSGVVVTVAAETTEARIDFGRSFLSSLSNVMDGALNGAIGTREDQLGARITEATAKLSELDLRAGKLEKRLLSRFTAMETAISSMKSTGAYLTNLVAQWNKSG